MRLVSLRMENYRKYRDETIEFADGIMGIVGRNGAGKTTIIEAIGWCLYGAPAARSAQGEVATTGLPRGTPCTVTLEMEAGGEAIRVVRTFKAGQTGTADLYVQGRSGAVVTGSDEVTGYVGRRLGMDRVAFFSSVFARQKELAELANARPFERREIITRLLRIDTVDKALRMIKDDEKSLQTKIGVLRAEAADTHAIKNSIEGLETQLGTKRSEALEASKGVSALSKSLAAAKRRLEQQDAAKENHDRHQASLGTAESLLAEKLAHKKTEQDTLDGLKKEKERLKAIEPEIKDYSKVRKSLEKMESNARKHAEKVMAEDAVASARSKLSEQQAKVEEYEERRSSLAPKILDMKKLDSKLDRLSKKLEKIQDAGSRARVRADDLSERAGEKKETASQLRGLGEGGVCPTCKQRLGASFAGLVADLGKAASALEAEADERRREADERRREADSVQSDIDAVRSAKAAAAEADKEMAALKSQIDEVEKHMSGLRGDEKKHVRTLSRRSGLSYDEVTHDLLKKRILGMEKIREEVISLRSRTKAMPGTARNVRRLDGEIAAQNKEVEKARRALEDVAFDAAAHSDARSEHESLGADYHAAREEVVSLEGDAKTIEANLDAAMNDLVSEKKRAGKIKRMEKEIEDLAELRGTMSDFKSNLTSRIQPALGSRASDLMRRMTGGRYSVVELDHNYDIKIESDGKKFRTARFSGGEQDLACLCLRIAVSQELLDRAGSAGPSFIVLDEVFGSQDSERKTAILEALSEISHEFRQIILITHIEDVKDALPYALHVQEGRNGPPTVSIEGRATGGGAAP